jgi:two-component system response regulator CpxR
VHILLVDDDAELCALLIEFLQREGYSVDCEHEGNRGLQKAAQPGVDLVVLDVMLPGIDGFEILRRLREQSKVPVIMLTARGEDVDRIVGLELGADDYLPKPFNPRELAARASARFCAVANRASAAPRRTVVNGIVPRHRHA